MFKSITFFTVKSKSNYEQERSTQNDFFPYVCPDVFHKSSLVNNLLIFNALPKTSQVSRADTFDLMYSLSVVLLQDQNVHILELCFSFILTCRIFHMDFCMYCIFLKVFTKTGVPLTYHDCPFFCAEKRHKIKREMLIP